ncbi:MAG: DUF1957 domain-containing protein [Opitutaceae bacterium]|nr:DUF1957 domain-containing protein [Opitutaceae bacterium]
MTSRKANAAARHLVLLLHAHLPDCRRPDEPDSLEETWFFGALMESYLPIARMLERLEREGIAVRLTLSLSPTLICMLQDPALRDRFRRRLAATEQLARRDAREAQCQLRHVAEWHAGFFQEIGRFFDQQCGGDLLRFFGQQHAAGRLELATTAATHAFLPAHQAHPARVRAQIGVGLDVFFKAFGFRPDFFWLPECGYYPGLDDILASFGVRAFALESHGITRARPPPSSGRTPIRCPSGILALGRDTELSRLVWSAPGGYPGHPDYREFHRDRIHTVDEAALTACLGGTARRLPTGLKYWRVTGPHQEKAWYDPAAAAGRACEHAKDFLQRLGAAPEGHGIWFVPFDAELFGHWWFEGPIWLEELFRLLPHEPRIAAETVTPAVEASTAHVGRPAPSSWGEAGDYSYWINSDTAWLYPQLDETARRFEALLARFGHEAPAGLAGRTLRQASRTLLLAQASDWPFLIRAGTAREAAVAQVGGLLSRCARLCDELEAGAPTEATLRRCESLDRAFPSLDLRHFQPRSGW